MSARDNFSQAMREMMNGNLTGDDENTAGTTEAAAATSTTESTSSTPSTTASTATRPTTTVHTINDAPLKPAGERSTTVLAEDAIIIGEIHTGGDLNLLGSVKGNISVRGDIRACGKVIGNVDGGNLALTGSSIKGDVTSSGQLTMDSDALVLGNVNAADVVLDGRIKGDINVTGDTTLNPSAVVAGNIYSGTINMAAGARVQGELHITKLESADAAFKDIDFDINV